MYPALNSIMRLRNLITSMGWCCEYAFFRCYKQTGMIAARLGADDSTVRKHKARFKCGELKCERCQNCKLAAIRRAGR